jgi:hypothetical protein
MVHKGGSSRGGRKSAKEDNGKGNGKGINQGTEGRTGFKIEMGDRGAPPDAMDEGFERY